LRNGGAIIKRDPMTSVTFSSSSGDEEKLVSILSGDVFL